MLCIIKLLLSFIHVRTAISNDYTYWCVICHLDFFPPSDDGPEKPIHLETILTFKRRIKSHLPFAGVIRYSPYSSRFQDKG